MHPYLLYSVAAAGFAILLVGFRIRAYEASGWLAGAIVGQAAALQLIDAGPHLHYQHLRSIPDLLMRGSAVPLLIVAAQAAIAGARLVSRRSEILSALKAAPVRSWQWVVMGALFLAMSATLSRNVGQYLQELLFGTALQLVSLATIVAFALALPDRLVGAARSWFNRVLGDESNSQPQRRFDSFSIGCALWVSCLAVLLATFVYERHPHIPDEVGYVIHARYFAHGMVAMPAPPVPAAFDLDLFTSETDRWYSTMPPGWPAMLAVGSLVNLEWLVNPLLAGVNVILASLLVNRLYDKRTARVACLLLCVSPWHLFMAMNFMNHTFMFTCLLIAALAVHKMRTSGNGWFGIPGGIAVALISWNRPLDGVTAAIAMGLWSLGARGRSFRFAPTLVLALVTAAVSSAQLAYNASLTGSMRTFPVMQYFDRTYGPGVNDLGFGPNRGLGWDLDPFPGHGLRDVLVNANLNITSMNVELFGWGVGSLSLLALFAISGGMAKREYFLCGFAVLVVASQSLYWFSGGPDFGARYWYPLLLPCILVTIRGLDWLTKHGTSLGGPRIILGVSAFAMSAVLTFIPWRSVDKYHNYRNMRPDVRTIAATPSLKRALVFVRGNRAPDYSSAAVYNPIELKSDAPVFAWDCSQIVREKVLIAYSDRPVWFLDGPTLTGRGFEIAGGPLSNSDAAHFQPSRHLKSQ